MFLLLKRPGGLDRNGDPNRGISVSVIAQINFASLCFLARHMTKRVDRTLTSAGVQLANVKKARALQLQEKSHHNPMTFPSYDVKNWPKTMERLESYIGGHRGQDGSRLNYMTR